MKGLIWFIVTIMLSACAHVREQACNPLDSNTRHSIVKINNNEGTASGVVIAQNQIITVAHAINDNTPTYVEISGETRRAEVLGVDKDLDLALIYVQTDNMTPVRMSSRLLHKDEAVWVVGFPLAAQQKVSLGMYDSMFRGRLYSTVHVNQGTSGGGLLHCVNGKSKLVGIVHGYVAKNSGGNYVNVGDSTSVPVNKIRSFISSLSEYYSSL